MPDKTPFLEALVTVTTQTSPRSTEKTGRRLKINPAYIFLTPYIVSMLLFSIGPALYSFLLMFSKFRMGRPIFFAAGIQNFITVINDPFLPPAFLNVLRFLVVSVPFGIIMVTLVSLVLHAQPGRLSVIMRTLYFIPGAVAGPALVMLFLFTFNPDLSVFRPLLNGMGFTDIKQIVNNNGAPVIFTIMGFFGGAGAWIAIFYGALQGVSEEVTEAAIMDGCNPWQLAWFIKRPLISRYIAYMTILVLAGNIQIFTEPQLMSSVSATLSGQWSPNQMGYYYAFKLGNFGASAVVSVLMMFIGIVTAYVVIRVTNFYSTDFSSSD